MDLHAKIMNIELDKLIVAKAINEVVRSVDSSYEILFAVYSRGHRDARHAAAELATGTKFQNCTMESAEKENQ